MPLGELGAVGAKYQRQMRVVRDEESQSFAKQNVFGGICNMVFAADDV